MNRSLRYLLVGIALVVVVGVLFVPHSAHAFNPFNPASIVEGAFRFVLGALMELGVAIAKWLIIYAAAFMQIMIAINSKVLGADIVNLGFSITLNIANLGFVLAIILIAFGTMFQYGEYQIQKSIVRLITAAFLVNFSLLIAGFFVDFSNITADFFFRAASHTAERGEFSENLANALNVGALNDQDAEGAGIFGAGSSIGDSFIKLIIGSLVMMIFIFLITVVFLTLAFMTLVRYIYIVFLLIVMPIAWLFWVIPDLHKYSRQWWNAFIRWTFFLPVSAFFVYLSIKSSGGIKKAIGEEDAIDHVVALRGYTLGNVETLLQVTVMVGLMLGGLYAANKLGIVGAKAGISTFNNFKKGVVSGLTPQRVKDFSAQRLGERVGRTATAPIRVPANAAKNVFSRVPVLNKLPGLKNVAQSRQDAKYDNAQTIANKIESGEMDLNEARIRANGSHDGTTRKERAEYILALAMREHISGGTASKKDFDIDTFDFIPKGQRTGKVYGGTTKGGEEQVLTLTKRQRELGRREYMKMQKYKKQKEYRDKQEKAKKEKEKESASAKAQEEFEKFKREFRDFKGKNKSDSSDGGL